VDHVVVNILDPLTGERTNVIDITQRIRNRASLTQMARPIGYQAPIIDLKEVCDREIAAARAHTKRCQEAIADIQHIIAYAKSGEMKPCDSE
jgi:hypothetical protein